MIKHGDETNDAGFEMLAQTYAKMVRKKAITFEQVPDKYKKRVAEILGMTE